MKDEDIKLNMARIELTKMISAQPSALQFFRFLSTRKRSTPISDVPQLSVYMRQMFGEQFDPTQFHSVLNLLVKAGFCLVRGSEGREKIYWQHWIFPIFSTDSQSLLGIETKPIKSLQGNRNGFAQALRQVRKIQATYHLPKSERPHQADIDFGVEVESPKIRTELSDFSVDEILTELRRRGLNVNLNLTKQ
ncbi:MAG: hypothetical protein AB7F86_08175 [Bdellovibrionales bacterium]